MKFYGREDELNELKLLGKRLPAMVVITGRRRVGKTELVKEFLKHEKGVYLFVDSEKSERMLLEEYGMQLREAFNLGDYVVLETWENLIKLIFDLTKKDEIVVVFDEFQRFLNITPSFINQLQKYWDLHRSANRVFFILTGSSIGMMKEIFIKQKSPLFKRAQNILFMEPFDFKNISEVLNDMGIKDIKTKIEIYSLFGGVIYYYTLMDYYNISSRDGVLNNLILRKFAPLRNEVRDVMVECFGKEHRTYYAILTAIALGKGTKSEISNLVDVKETSLSHYLYDLMDLLGVVQHKVPITENKEKSKKGKYFLKDNFFKFYFRFIYRNMSYYEIGNYEYIKEKIKSEFNSFVRFIFEDVCKEFFINFNKTDKTGKLPFKFSKILNELKEKAKLVQWHNQDRKEYFAMFSKSGFEKDIPGKLLFDLNDISDVFDLTKP